jgi:hypothetical protein
MVILIYQSLGSYNLFTYSDIIEEHRRAICIYCETVDDRKLMMQDYEIDKSDNVIFGKLLKFRDPPHGALTGLFKP